MRKKRQIAFIQGGGADTHDEWDNKLVASLQRELGSDYEIHYPRMPNEADPSYPVWKRAIEQTFETLKEDAILVGHSVGATILLKTLTETARRKFGGIFLIATPFVGEGGWSADDLQFPAQLGAFLPKSVPIHFYHGLEDETAPPSHADLYSRAIPQAHIHRLPGRDHQLNNNLSEIATDIVSLYAPH